jgi:ParB/RepB/Spo0J family partition protein
MSSQNFSNVLIENIQLSEVSDNLLRLDFYSQSHIEELIKSISSKGLLETLLVHRNDADGRLTMLNGHYRIRALRRLGVKEASCRVVVGDEKEATVQYLASFIQKKNVTALEEGHIIMELLSKGYQLVKIGELWGKSASWACRRVKLITSLEEEIKKDVRSGKLSPRVAQEIARLPRGNEQKRVHNIIIKNNLTKDETAKVVDKWLTSDENGKTLIEKEFSKKIPIIPQKVCKSSPEDLLKGYVVQCSKSIGNLISYMEYLKDFSRTWPWTEYEKFCKQFEQLSGLVAPVSFQEAKR